MAPSTMARPPGTTPTTRAARMPTRTGGRSRRTTGTATTPASRPAASLLLPRAAAGRRQLRPPTTLTLLCLPWSRSIRRPLPLLPSWADPWHRPVRPLPRPAGIAAQASLLTGPSRARGRARARARA
eukprot:3483086-Alexandrium_andersonii.AAC.1